MERHKKMFMKGCFAFVDVDVDGGDVAAADVGGVCFVVCCFSVFI